MLAMSLAVVFLPVDGDIWRVTADYCRSAQAVRRYTPLAVGREIKMMFVLEGTVLYTRVDSHAEPVALVVGDRVTVLNGDLWEVFYAYCFENYGAEYRRIATTRLLISASACAVSIALALFLLTGYRRR